MRLIDADKLKINLYHNKKVVLNDDLVKCIDDTKTAYDIDKVVEKLEEEKIKKPWDHEDRMYNCAVNNAIEIVKQGGVSDDVCEWKLEDDNLMTGCGDYFNLYDNCTDKFKHCPRCGKKIKVVG